MSQKHSTCPDPLSNTVEHQVFAVSEAHPVCALHHVWTGRQALRHDMHFGFELGVLLSGRMERHCQGFVSHLGPGQMWLCGMWEPHGYEVLEASEAVVLIAYPPVVARENERYRHPVSWLAAFDEPPQSRPQVSPELQKHAMTLGEQIRATIVDPIWDSDAWWRLKFDEALLLLEHNWTPTQKSKAVFSHDSMATARRALYMVFNSQHAVTIGEAAHACGLNRNTFARHFKRLTGIRFSEFGLRYRVNAAADRLNDLTIPIKTIAAEWGFTDSSHFNRCFKKYYGCAPSAYRERSRRE